MSIHLVYYSLLLSEKNYASLMEQLFISAQSLRRIEPQIQIQMVIFGKSIEKKERLLLRKLKIKIIEAGSYEENLKLYCNPKWIKTLLHYPVLHKWISLRHIVIPKNGSVLYLDNDTYILQSLGPLMASASSVSFAAREEPGSPKSALIAGKKYFNQSLLLRYAGKKKNELFAQFNTGVCLMGHKTARLLAEDLQSFFNHLLRLFASMPKNGPQLGYLQGRNVPELPKELFALPRYPSENLWIVEEIAVWLWLAKIPTIKFKYLPKKRVLQGHEFKLFRSAKEVSVIHYFGNNFSEFKKRFLE